MTDVAPKYTKQYLEATLKVLRNQFAHATEQALNLYFDEGQEKASLEQAMEADQIWQNIVRTQRMIDELA